MRWEMKNLWGDIKKLPWPERVACLAPGVLIIGGGLAGAILGLTAMGINILLCRSNAKRIFRLLGSVLIITGAVAVYWAFAAAWKTASLQHQSVKELFGAIALLLSGAWILYEFGHGIWQQKALNPFGVRIARSEQPRKYFVAMVIWGVLTVCVLFLVYAFLFLSEHA